MLTRRFANSLILLGIGLISLAANNTLCAAEEPGVGPAADAVPADEVSWGISSSASGMKDIDEWFPKMNAIGVRWVRLFPEWNGVERKEGEFKWEKADLLAKTADAHKLQLSAVLMGSVPWGKGGSHTFPVDNLPAWSKFVEASVERYKQQIHYWEIWNEGNGGFNDGMHNTTDYAKLAAAAYKAAKKADATAQVGLTVASFDPAYLHQAILAQAKAGTPNHFDYLCIHPYELGDRLSDRDGEILYLWMSHMLRDVLKSAAPEKADADIWVTEIGRRVDAKSPHGVSEATAARDIVKLYVMSLAQGIKRTMWFEGQDPAGEEAGFGLLKRDGTERASYRAFKTMTTALGPNPKYIGWVALGEQKRGYGFVFQGPKSPVLVAWLPFGEKDRSEKLGIRGTVTFAQTGKTHTWSTEEAIPLQTNPIFVTGIGDEMVKTAEANAKKPFPWGGDYSSAKQVSLDFNELAGERGVYMVNSSNTPMLTFPGGWKGAYVQANQAVSFYTHPSFASIHQREYYIRVTIRRIGSGNLGFNLNYEQADTQGKTPYKNVGIWFGASASSDFQTHTWHVKDACFAKMWGYDFTFRPEQSVPFVISRVEVSTKPFKD